MATDKSLRPGVSRIFLVSAGLLACLLTYTMESSADDENILVAKGRYLAEHVVTCVQCHSQHDWTTFGSPPKQPHYAGQDCPADKESIAADQPGAWLSRLCTPNITSDPDTGIGGWSRTDIMNAFRDGVRPDGTPLFPIMWWALHAISDEDAEAIAAYIQTLAPVVHEQPGRGQAISQEMRTSVMERLSPSPLTSPPQNDSVAYGEYLAEIARCRFCHTPRDAPGQSPARKSLDRWRPLSTPGTGGLFHQPHHP